MTFISESCVCTSSCMWNRNKLRYLKCSKFLILFNTRRFPFIGGSWATALLYWHLTLELDKWSVSQPWMEWEREKGVGSTESQLLSGFAYFFFLPSSSSSFVFFTIIVTEPNNTGWVPTLPTCCKALYGSSQWPLKHHNVGVFVIL